MSHNRNCAFHWKTGEPSIFLKGPGFAALSTGKTMSEVASTIVKRKTAETGRNPGTIRGISRAEKVLANRWGGTVSKARPA